jgi:hypothetical protein
LTKLYRICVAIRVWNGKKNDYDWNTSYYKDYSPNEIDLTSDKSKAQRFDKVNAERILNHVKEYDKSEGVSYWIEEID